MMRNCILLLGCAVGFSCQAVSFEEKDFLHRITVELELIEQDIKSNSVNFSSSSKSKDKVVNYEEIVNDLNKIQAGIKRTIDSHGFHLSDFSPISGEY